MCIFETRQKLEEAEVDTEGFRSIEELVVEPQLCSFFSRTVADIKRGDTVSSEDLTKLSTWIAGCLMHTNHQRPGAVVNMKLTELQKALQDGTKDRLVVVVQDHKTATTGSARVVTKGILAERVATYASVIRPAMQADSGLAFPNSRGNPLDHLSRRVTKLAESVGICNLPTATWSRHMAATAVQHLPESSRSAAAVTMSHSEQTQQRYYAHTKSSQQAAEGFAILESVRSGSKPKKPRTEYSEEELEIISLYFAHHIATNKQPSMTECKEFVENHPISRSAKQVWDKLRNIIKQ